MNAFNDYRSKIMIIFFLLLFFTATIIDIINMTIKSEKPETPIKTVYALEVKRNQSLFRAIEILNKCDVYRNSEKCIYNINEEFFDHKNRNISLNLGETSIDYNKNEDLDMLNDTVPLKNDLQFEQNEMKYNDDSIESFLNFTTGKYSFKDVSSTKIHEILNDSNTLYDFDYVDRYEARVFKIRNSDFNPYCSYEKTENYTISNQVLNNLFIKNMNGTFDCVKCLKGTKNIKVLVLEESWKIHYRKCKNLSKYKRRRCYANRKWSEKIRKGCLTECSCSKKN